MRIALFSVFTLLLASTARAEDEAPPLPRVLLMVAEQNLGQSGANYWWDGKHLAMDLDTTENALAQLLTQKGFTVVDRRLLDGKVTVTNAMTSAEPSDAAIKEFAVKSGADVVFVGKAIATDAGVVLGTQMHSLQANISLRILNLDDARIVTSTAETQVFTHVDGMIGSSKALQKAANKAGEKMVPKLIEAWSNHKQVVKVKLSKLKDYKQLTQIEKQLRELPKVKQVTRRSFAAKVAEMEIEVLGSANTLAESVSALKLSVDSVTPNTLSLSVE